MWSVFKINVSCVMEKNLIVRDWPLYTTPIKSSFSVVLFKDSVSLKWELCLWVPQFLPLLSQFLSIDFSVILLEAYRL